MNTLRRSPKRFVKDTKNWISGSSGLLLYFIPFPLVFATIKAFANGNLLGIIINIVAYGAYLMAAQSLRRGLQAETIYREKRIAYAPKWPLKTFSAVLVALATFTVAWLGAGNRFVVAIAFGAGAFLGMLLCYGVDPRKKKMVFGDHGYSIEEITRVISDAENLIVNIENANNNIRNGEFNLRIDRICEQARGILAEMESNPGTIRRARKFLLVYLESTSKVTTGYANTHLQVANPELEQNFRNVLDSIETTFKEQKNKLLEEDLFDLDVQIEVLAKQLKNEGIV